MLAFKDFIFEALIIAIEAYRWLLLIYIVVGYFITNRYASWYVFIQELCEPPINMVRRLSRNRLVIDRMDFSPIIVFFGLMLVQALLRKIFYDF